MGSSAGAGSGEFHVYRHLRRKEYARQKNIQNQSAREAADDAYQQKLEDNRRAAEEKTAKKRAKRQKKKLRAKKPREAKKPEAKDVSESSGSASEGEEAANEKEEVPLKGQAFQETNPPDEASSREEVDEKTPETKAEEPANES